MNWRARPASFDAKCDCLPVPGQLEKHRPEVSDQQFVRAPPGDSASAIVFPAFDGPGRPVKAEVINEFWDVPEVGLLNGPKQFLPLG